MVYLSFILYLILLDSGKRERDGGLRGYQEVRGKERNGFKRIAKLNARSIMECRGRPEGNMSQCVSK